MPDEFGFALDLFKSDKRKIESARNVFRQEPKIATLLANGIDTAAQVTMDAKRPFYSIEARPRYAHIGLSYFPSTEGEIHTLAAYDQWIMVNAAKTPSGLDLLPPRVARRRALLLSCFIFAGWSTSMGYSPEEVQSLALRSIAIFSGK